MPYMPVRFTHPPSTLTNYQALHNITCNERNSIAGSNNNYTVMLFVCTLVPRPSHLSICHMQY